MFIIFLLLNDGNRATISNWLHHEKHLYSFIENKDKLYVYVLSSLVGDVFFPSAYQRSAIGTLRPALHANAFFSSLHSASASTWCYSSFLINGGIYFSCARCFTLCKRLLTRSHVSLSTSRRSPFFFKTVYRTFVQLYALLSSSRQIVIFLLPLSPPSIRSSLRHIPLITQPRSFSLLPHGAFARTCVILLHAIPFIFFRLSLRFSSGLLRSLLLYHFAIFIFFLVFYLFPLSLPV